MKPDIWGPPAWIFLHSITLDYPENPTQEDKDNITIFMNSLSQVLPCKKCRINFKSHIKTFPLTDEILSSKQNLIKWLIDIHNSVNKLNCKKILSHEEALKYILNLYEPNNNMLLIIIIFCIIITIIVILFNIFIK